MPRPHRTFPSNTILHVLNRGNDRKRIFQTPRDYLRFLRLMHWAKARVPLRIVGYALMPNHWHLLVWPENTPQVSRYLHRLCSAHSAHLRRITGTVGEGHIYQDRFRAVPIDEPASFYRALHYIEANALRAGLVPRAEQWRWSSLSERLGAGYDLLDQSPFEIPEDWQERVNAPSDSHDL